MSSPRPAVSLLACLILFACMAIRGVPVSSAGTPPDVLAADFANVPTGGLPADWVPNPGSVWTVTGDGEHGEGDHRVLSSTDGTIFYQGTEFGDFTFTTRLKYFAEWEWWEAKIFFREVDDAHGYQVGLARSGAVFLERRDGKATTRLGISTALLPLMRGDWFWVRVRAQGANLAVDLSTDGVRFVEQIACTDPGTPLPKGRIGLKAGGHMNFEPQLNLWHNDEAVYAKRAWIDDLSTPKLYRQDKLDETRYALEAAIDAVEPTSGLEVQVQIGSRTTTRKLDPLHAGENKVTLWVPLAVGEAKGEASVRLRRSGATLDARNVMVAAIPDSERFSPANPKPEVAPAFDQQITRDDYRRYLDTYFATLDREKIKLEWGQTRPGDAAMLYRSTGERKYLAQVLAGVRAWIADRRSGKALTPNADFCGRLPETICWELALQEGDLTDAEKADVRAMATDVALRGTFEGGGVMNRALGFALGVRPILRIVPDIAVAPELKTYADHVEAQIIASGEELENSANYAPITLFFITWWLESNHRPDLYENPRI